MRRFATGLIKSKGRDSVAATIGKLARNVRRILDHLRMTDSSIPATVRLYRDHKLVATQTRVLESLNAARATGAFERRFHALARVSLLIIDDFGLKPLRPPHDEDSHDLFAERCEQIATIITSNLDFAEWGDAFPNRLPSDRFYPGAIAS